MPRSLPAFMHSCPQCTSLIDDVLKALVEAVTDALDAEVDRAESALSRHLADLHADCLPPPHVDSCETCAPYIKGGSTDSSLRQHLARGLFLPAGAAS